MSVPPAFSDISKTSNDANFYHIAAAKIDVKSKAPNGVSFNVKGTSNHEGPTSGSVEAKYADPPTGMVFNLLRFITTTNLHTSPALKHSIILRPGNAVLLIFYQPAGLSLTQTWTTANVLSTKLELDNNIAKGLKAETLTDFVPSSQKFGAKFNLYFKQPNFNARAFFDVLKGPVANVDAVLGRDGFLVGGEAGYDVQKAAITKYSLAVGYTAAEYSAAITATSSLSVFAASYYHKVNSQAEAGAKATWDSKGNNNVGMEVAGKYRLDPTSFAKAKINDRGIAALAYNVKLRPGVTVGLGLSLDTQNLNEAAHKVGTSFEFEG
ncbi:MAG: hypothetical protein ASARMPREDX12_001466 [Alectoria sarmentosa]|nr:MAG: hypothetical protein ASARMPRED_000420 [Alectoria sarmentosa]CAD6583857.1 MAG: hypothetical protein ASARMPREDX12_001466 [Alectoria sarmentosa]